MGNWQEFFQDDAGRLSMTRLLGFISIFPASYVVVKNPDADTLGWYLGAYVLQYVGGKGIEAVQTVKINKANKEAESVT